MPRKQKRAGFVRLKSLGGTWITWLRLPSKRRKLYGPHWTDITNE